MSSTRATLEVIAPTVEEALAKGLGDLGLPREAVEVEVLDEGSRGLFGIGSRQARIRLTIKDVGAQASSAAPQKVETIQPAETASAPPEPYTPPAPRPTPRPTPTPVVEMEAEEEPGEEDLSLRVARETVTELLEKMKVRAHVSSHYSEPDESRSKAAVLVDIHGNDLSILIGRQAETLNALQYITNLIVGKELGKSIPVVIDVEGYRKRREQQLRQLARRMAEQAVKTGRRQVLEPMPANERRIIHIELRDHPAVETESIGEEPRRKVTINVK